MLSLRLAKNLEAGLVWNKKEIVCSCAKLRRKKPLNIVKHLNFRLKKLILVRTEASPSVFLKITRSDTLNIKELIVNFVLK